MISKSPDQRSGYVRSVSGFPSARAAFKAFLIDQGLQPGDVILLPAYIGWSPREGSGVFDPVEQLGLRAAFYNLDAQLWIDLDHFAHQLALEQPKCVLFIHYFGYVDPAFDQAVSLAKSSGAWILEDEAHSFLSDLIGGVCGRAGHASIFSLHKLLPLESGGLLVYNRDTDQQRAPGDDRTACRLHRYDLHRIAERRRGNAAKLSNLLEGLEGVEQLRSTLDRGVIPQTFPVLIHGVPRFDLYRVLNERGIGVVALYHTMINHLPNTHYPKAHYVAERILNLPIHQDVSDDDLLFLVRELTRAVEEFRVASGRC